MGAIVFMTKPEQNGENLWKAVGENHEFWHLLMVWAKEGVVKQARSKKRRIAAIKIKSQTFINFLLEHLAYSYVWVSVLQPVDHLTPIGKTLCDIAIVTILLRQCWFQQCHNLYVLTLGKNLL